MAMIENDLRSRSKDYYLTDLMTVLLETPEMKAFDPSKAVNFWNSSSIKGRRIEYMENRREQWCEEELEERSTPEWLRAVHLQEDTENEYLKSLL